MTLVSVYLPVNTVVPLGPNKISETTQFVFLEFL